MNARSHTIACVCPLDCPDTCAMLVTIDNGRATRLEADPSHPFTRGFLCQKMAHYLDRVNSPDRVLYPLRRISPKGSPPRFERISWDEAIAIIVGRFRELAGSEDGPQSILPYSYCGTMGLLQSSSLDRRFFHCLGASMLDRTICAAAGARGYEYTVGRGRLGADPLAAAGCRLFINWGSNTAYTNSHLWSLMVEARKTHGATILTIDPYRSPTAERSDLHLPIRPGTDAALALGLMHVIWAENWHDQDYLECDTTGADRLRDRVLSHYGPDRVASITGLSTSQIRDLARLYASTHPSLIRLNYGLQRHGGGGMAVRTIACLPAVVGAWRHAGAGALLTTSGTYNFNNFALTRPDLAPPGTRTVNMNELSRALAGELDGPPVRALFVYNSNPAAVAPDAGKVRRGLLREDLLTVVHEQVFTDTTDLADLVLPATMQPEHWDLHGSYGHHFVMLNRPALNPPGECRSNTDVFRALAAGLGLEPDLFPDDLSLIDQALEGTGITRHQLEETPSIRLRLPEPYAPFAEGHFPTPSGKCELESERMRADGFDSLPTYIPPHEDPQIRPDLAARYPIQLLSPPRPQFLNSTFAGSPIHRRRAGAPTIELAKTDAVARGLVPGQWARIYNDRGAFFARVSLTGSVRPGVAVSTGIYWSKLVPGRSNVNATTSAALTDMGGGATFFDNLVEVEPAEPPPDS